MPRPPDVQPRTRLMRSGCDALSRGTPTPEPPMSKPATAVSSNASALCRRVGVEHHPKQREHHRYQRVQGLSRPLRRSTMTSSTAANTPGALSAPSRNQCHHHTAHPSQDPRAPGPPAPATAGDATDPSWPSSASEMRPLRARPPPPAVATDQTVERRQLDGEVGEPCRRSARVASHAAMPYHTPAHTIAAESSPGRHSPSIPADATPRKR